MTYQPPVVGVKQLLNFKAHSWPGPAAWAAVLGALLAAAALVIERRRARGAAPGTTLPAALLVAAVMGMTACGSGPRDIRYGEDTCAHCRMSVSDPRYGTELVTVTGRQLVFDAIECLAAHLEDPEAANEARTLWVTDFTAPGTLIPAETAFYLRSPALPSPMGMNLTAFGTAEARADALVTHGGEALDWPAVLAAARARGPRGSGGGHAHQGRDAH
jgi:copper chaperone NosL